MKGKTSIIALQVRVQGDFLNASLAFGDRPEDATLLGSIHKGVPPEDRSAFIALMTKVASTLVKDLAADCPGGEIRAITVSGPGGTA